jgi:endonuclease YncB( thermonuclease family)
VAPVLVLALALGLWSGCEVKPPPQPPATPSAPPPTLLQSVERGDLEQAAALLAGGADVNAPDAEELTPLHYAAFAGNAALVRLLLHHHANPGARDAFGFTPLHAAAREGHLEAARALVAAGAEPSAMDREGLTPRDVADCMNHPEVAAYLASLAPEPEPLSPPVEPSPPGIPDVPASIPTGGDFRVWTSTSGAEVEAEFLQRVLHNVILRTREGHKVRVPLHRLSPTDQEAVRRIEQSRLPVLTRPDTTPPQRPTRRESIAARFRKEKGWTVLEGCRLRRRRGNDGDSFHVSHDGKEYIFRLYYVDAPETSLNFPDRVREQSRYFDLDESDALQLGKDAKTFTERLLASGPFTVVTRWEDARGNSRLPRHFAFVITEEGDLDELLTAEGMVRLYGMRVDGGLGSQKARELKKRERDARREHVGAWGGVRAAAAP